MEAPMNCSFSFKGYRKIPSNHFDSSQDEKNKLWKAMKEVSVKLKKSKTMRKVKSLFQRTKDIDQESLLINDELNLIDLDQHTIEKKDYQNQNQNQNQSQTLNLNNLHNSSNLLRIYIKIASKSKTMVVEAKGHHIINDIKSKIRAFEGTEPDEYSLFFNGKELEDYRTLLSLGVKPESTLHLIFQPKTLYPITVRIPSGKVLNFEVNVLYTIRDIKTIIESFIGCPVSECKMFYDGNELDESKSLSFYGVEENASFELQSCWIQILVKTWSGKTVTLFVRKSSTVREVKEKLFCKMGMPVVRQRIVFSGKRLDDNRALSSYNVGKDSTLHMVLWH